MERCAIPRPEVPMQLQPSQQPSQLSTLGIQFLLGQFVERANCEVLKVDDEEKIEEESRMVKISSWSERCLFLDH
jgi:hypothetical protein